MKGTVQNSETAAPAAPGPFQGRSLGNGDALLIIDVQNDFLPGGRLAVPRGDEVITPLNRCITAFKERDLPIFITRDWHPKNHCSFRSQGGPWPEHCVQFSHGADFPAQLRLPETSIVVSKPGVADRETYSAFEGTGLEQELRRDGITTLFAGGLATDYCVLNTVLGALERRFGVFLLCDAIRAVNVRPDDGDNAIRLMCSRGAVPFETTWIAR